MCYRMKRNQEIRGLGDMTNEPYERVIHGGANLGRS